MSGFPHRSYWPRANGGNNYSSRPPHTVRPPSASFVKNEPMASASRPPGWRPRPVHSSNASAAINQHECGELGTSSFPCQVNFIGGSQHPIVGVIEQGIISGNASGSTVDHLGGIAGPQSSSVPRVSLFLPHVLSSSNESGSRSILVTNNKTENTLIDTQINDNNFATANIGDPSGILKRYSSINTDTTAPSNVYNEKKEEFSLQNETIGAEICCSSRQTHSVTVTAGFTNLQEATEKMEEQEKVVLRTDFDAVKAAKLQALKAKLKVHVKSGVGQWQSGHQLDTTCISNRTFTAEQRKFEANISTVAGSKDLDKPLLVTTHNIPKRAALLDPPLVSNAGHITIKQQAPNRSISSTNADADAPNSVSQIKDKITHDIREKNSVPAIPPPIMKRGDTNREGINTSQDTLKSGKEQHLDSNALTMQPNICLTVKKASPVVATLGRGGKAVSKPLSENRTRDGRLKPPPAVIQHSITVAPKIVQHQAKNPRALQGTGNETAQKSVADSLQQSKPISVGTGQPTKIRRVSEKTGSATDFDAPLSLDEFLKRKMVNKMKASVTQNKTVSSQLLLPSTSLSPLASSVSHAAISSGGTSIVVNHPTTVKTVNSTIVHTPTVRSLAAGFQTRPTSAKLDISPQASVPSKSQPTVAVSQSTLKITPTGSSVSNLTSSSVPSVITNSSSASANSVVIQSSANVLYTTASTTTSSVPHSIHTTFVPSLGKASKGETYTSPVTPLKAIASQVSLIKQQSSSSGLVINIPPGASAKAAASKMMWRRTAPTDINKKDTEPVTIASEKGVSIVPSITSCTIADGETTCSGTVTVSSGAASGIPSGSSASTELNKKCSIAATGSSVLPFERVTLRGSQGILVPMEKQPEIGPTIVGKLSIPVTTIVKPKGELLITKTKVAPKAVSLTGQLNSLSVIKETTAITDRPTLLVGDTSKTGAATRVSKLTNVTGIKESELLKAFTSTVKQSVNVLADEEAGGERIGSVSSISSSYLSCNPSLCTSLPSSFFSTCSSSHSTATTSIAASSLPFTSIHSSSASLYSAFSSSSLSFSISSASSSTGVSSPSNTHQTIYNYMLENSVLNEAFTKIAEKAGASHTLQWLANKKHVTEEINEGKNKLEEIILEGEKFLASLSVEVDTLPFLDTLKDFSNFLSLNSFQDSSLFEEYVTDLFNNYEKMDEEQALQKLSLWQNKQENILIDFNHQHKELFGKNIFFY